jgi:hypothetical protein
VSDLRDSGFAYPHRWSDIATLDPEHLAILDERQRDLEQFLYGAPESFDVANLLSPPAGAITTLIYALARHNRVRGRQVLVSWVLQLNVPSSTIDNLVIPLPVSLWPKTANPSNALSVPAAGASGRFTSAHANADAGGSFATHREPSVVDHRATAGIGTWAIDTQTTRAEVNGIGANPILAGHIIYGLEQ